MRSDAPRPVDAAGAGDRRPMVNRCFVDDGCPVGSGASGPINSIDAGGGATLLRKTECASR